MDKSVNEIQLRYISENAVDKDREDAIVLSKESKEQHTQFVDNNITMANRWLGESGDEFLFAANAISQYLIGALGYYDSKQSLLKQYKLAFDDIDTQLAGNTVVNLN
jgi:hypothetical protein